MNCRPVASSGHQAAIGGDYLNPCPSGWRAGEAVSVGEFASEVEPAEKAERLTQRHPGRAEPLGQGKRGLLVQQHAQDLVLAAEIAEFPRKEHVFAALPSGPRLNPLPQCLRSSHEKILPNPATSEPNMLFPHIRAAAVSRFIGHPATHP